MSCSGDLVRIAYPSDKLPDDLSKGFGYNNGGFILRRSDERLEYLLNRLARNNGGVIPDFTPIACGKCEECRLEYSKQWAQRLVCESTLYKHNWFITLTYDDDHLIDRTRFTVSPWSHELDYVPELRKDDFVKWIKRFREYFRRNFGHDDIRYYMCGEYGSLNHRPHFHAILFNCPIPDVKLVKQVSLGGHDYCYYSSDILAKTWGNGFVMLGEVNWNTCSYVSRYIMKKMYRSDVALYNQVCDLEGFDPLQTEYVNMSRRPGIARDYYDKNYRQIYNIDKVVLPDGKTVKPCRYFDRLYDIDYTDELSIIKSNRVHLAQLRSLNLNKGLNYNEANELVKKRHERLLRSIKKLKRNL